MKSFKLFLDNSNKSKRFIISFPKNISSLANPITITREKYEEPEPEQPKFKKKSEQVEIEDSDYLEIKNVERSPLLITDADQQAYTGRLQDTRTSEGSAKYAENDSYFIFINCGNSFKAVPVSCWYRFTQKIGYDIMSLEEAEAKLNKRKESDKWILHKRREKKEIDDKDIDFEELFDDDDGEDYDTFNEESKELDVAGEELKKLMKNYENNSSEETEKDEEDEENISEKKNIKDVKKNDKYNAEKDVKRRKTDILTIEILKKFIGNAEVELRDFLLQIKKKYSVDENNNREFIKNFIKKECYFRVDEATTKKFISLKKKI